mmetsp:Transcript_8955/g.20713  ORF Transcript_8955/g.20713 Transcript_8955/m.20713 type:complete len:127 (+) Transcript_8955:156-536(+)
MQHWVKKATTLRENSQTIACAQHSERVSRTGPQQGLVLGPCGGLNSLYTRRNKIQQQSLSSQGLKSTDIMMMSNNSAVAKMMERGLANGVLLTKQRATNQRGKLPSTGGSVPPTNNVPNQVKTKEA